MATSRRLVVALASIAAVLVSGTLGYRVLGFGWLDALYQAVTTVTTVGFREVQPFGAAEMVFTIALILVGVGTVLYTLTAVIGVVLEGDLLQLLGRRRMDRKLAAMSGHVVLCGWGRVGQAISRQLIHAARPVVIVDCAAERVAACDLPAIAGDATSDDVLRAAGVERAHVLVASLETDADNLFVTLSGRALNASLFIVARARDEASIDKLTRAGADRVVNPQEIGGSRMAAFILQPNVAEFVDVVMHQHNLEFRLGEVTVAPGSDLVGLALGNLPGGAQVLAVRHGPEGSFTPRPGSSTVVAAGDVLVVVGTHEELTALAVAGRLRP